MPSAEPADQPPRHPARDHGPVLVGVVPGQSAHVWLVGAAEAALRDARLVFATVDSGSGVSESDADGSFPGGPVDPDAAEDSSASFPPELQAHIAEALARAGEPADFTARALAGEPARQLELLARELGASLIVVGTRNPGFGGTMHELLYGSVAAQLAHRQARPVLVVPHPRPDDEGRAPREPRVAE